MLIDGLKLEKSDVEAYQEERAFANLETQELQELGSDMER